MTAKTLQNKPHYPVLDGLRGVASVIVVIFHLFEAHSTSHLDQIINHGYLAVDFFFLLSGFVIGYAYDDRWNKMSIGNFFKRRLIRLQPMVIIGMVIGAVTFYLQAYSIFPLINTTGVWQMLLVMLIGFFMLPVPLSMDVRGWQEMYPLNGPAWSLFFEYIVNILYAIIVRRFPKWLLSVLVLLSAVALIHLALTSTTGDVIGGWSLDAANLHIGFARVMYPFFAGLLLFRATKPVYIKHGFIWCSILVLAVLAFPRIGGSEHLWQNALYDSLSIILIFPVIVFMGASSEIKNKFQAKICKLLGDISYPIYITHYPFIYWYTGWVYDKHPSVMMSALVGIIVFILSFIVAFACLKLYDEPVRKWLQKKLSSNKAAT